MALPKIEPLSTEFEVSQNDSNAVKLEIEKLGKSIQDSTALGLKAATSAVVGNVPEMIRELTEDIKSGSIDNFATAINKLIKLTTELGIDLRDYNKDLAETVDKFTSKQMKLEDKLTKFREMGLKAEIKNGEVKLLTQRDVFRAQKEKIKNEKRIEKLTEDRVKLQADLDSKVWENSKARTKAQEKVIKNEEEIAQLRLDNEEIDKKTNTTADTGFSGNDQGFSKLTELKEAFMIIPDTIADAFGQFANVGKKAFSGFMTFLGAPLKTIGKMFKSIANIFKTARIMIALKVLAVIAAFQWVAENIEMIAGVFVNIWNKITGFFKDIIDWFKNSPVGKFFGLSGDDSDEPKPKRQYKNMDEDTYGIGEDGSEIAPTNLVDEFLPQSKDPAAAVVVDPVTNKIIKPGEPGYEKARANRLQTTQSYIADEQEVNAAMNDLRSVVGDNVVDGDEKTSAMLKSLESESNNIKPPTIINVQNNATSNTAQSQSSNVSGFIHHEPDESFKFVKQGNTGSYDF